MQRSRLLPIFFVAFVDLLGFGLILPLLPFYADAYGASAAVVGLLVASYAAAQLVGAPLLGRLSDRFGRRPVLLASIFGTFLGFLLLGFADPLGRQIALWLRDGPYANPNAWVLALLFVSRILDGLTGGNISVAQSYITDVTDEASRARGLGIIGAAFGLGVIFGPAIGGVLSVRSYAAPAFAAAALSALNLIMVAAFLPESLTEERRQAIAAEPRRAFSARALAEALVRPLVGPLLSSRFFFGLAFSMFQTIFPLYAQYHLDLDPRLTGYVLTYVGLLVVLVQGVAIGWLTARLSEPQLLFYATLLMGFGLLLWGFVPDLISLLIILAPIALAGGTFNTVINSALTKVVRQDEVGGTLGLSTSLESLTRAVAPSFGGALLGGLGTWAPGVFGAATLALLAPFMRRHVVEAARRAQEEETKQGEAIA